MKSVNTPPNPPRDHKRNDESMELLLDMFRQQHSTSHEQPQNNLWFADENALAYAAELNTLPCQFISNRWDVYQALASSYCEFSDFIWPEKPHIDHVFYRISKEKPVVLHLLNQLHQNLTESGRAFLTGGKQEGIKSIYSQAKKIFGECTLEKHGNTYCLVLSSPLRQAGKVNCQNYSELRPIDTVFDQPLFSKPGVFGWKKIDAGSAFLLQVLEQEKSQWQMATDRCLDLGCGYGLLALTLGKWGFGQEAQGLLAASDNNAAAILAANKNKEQQRLNASIWPDDCASSWLSKSDATHFDVIVCNPPFHQGFDTDTSLTDHFLNNTAKLLSRRGFAYFVVNAFIGLEKRASAFFSGIDTLANNGQFKVIKLSL